ncbi:hypothetical protein CHL72_11440, partial [Streptococcus pneumoniae]
MLHYRLEAALRYLLEELYLMLLRVDYPDGSSTEVSVSVNVLPAPETQTYKVTYRFESATADNNLPAEV